MGPSSRELGAICVPGSRDKGAEPMPGAQRLMYGSDGLPVRAIGEVKSSSVPPLASKLDRKVPGWRLLELV